MDTQHLLKRMTDPSVATPAMKDLGAVYALLLASVADRLEPDEVESFVALGVAIHRRTAQPPSVLSD